MPSTSVTLYRISNEKPVLVGALTRIGFEPGALPIVMQNVLRDITPPMRQEELRHVLTFDCPSMPVVNEAHVIEVGDHFLLRVEEFIAAHCSGSGPAHCCVYVSLLAIGPLQK